MRISDWSSDVCSSDLIGLHVLQYVAKTGDRFERFRREVVVAIERTDRRSEARRVGKVCVSTSRSRWSQYHSKKHKLARSVPIGQTTARSTVISHDHMTDVPHDVVRVQYTRCLI